MNDWIQNGLSPQEKDPIEMLWISCRNPLSQEPNPQLVAERLKEIPFVIAVDQFVTPTTKMANLVLPTTTLFEEYNMVYSHWHNGLSLNEKAVPPYFDSRSEWSIMNKLALKIREINPRLCTMPIYESEEDYLNHQFNGVTKELFGCHSIEDLRMKSVVYTSNHCSRNIFSQQPQENINFIHREAKENGFFLMPQFIDGKKPTADATILVNFSSSPICH